MRLKDNMAAVIEVRDDGDNSYLAGAERRISIPQKPSSFFMDKVVLL